MDCTPAEIKDFLNAIAVFAGVLFPVVVAARSLNDRDKSLEDPGSNEVRLWGDQAINCEIAAAALICCFFCLFNEASSKGLHIIGEIFICLVSAVGIYLYLRYMWAGFMHLKAQRKTSNVDIKGETYKGWRSFFRFWLVDVAGVLFSLFPLAAYGVSVAAVLPWIHLPHAAIFIVAAVSWLTFSGVMQTLLWYHRTWEKPGQGADPQTSPKPFTDMAPSENAPTNFS